MGASRGDHAVECLPSGGADEPDLAKSGKGRARLPRQRAAAWRLTAVDKSWLGCRVSMARSSKSLAIPPASLIQRASLPEWKDRGRDLAAPARVEAHDHRRAGKRPSTQKASWRPAATPLLFPS